VSVIGDQVGAVAVPLTAALVLDADAAQMGFLTAAVWVPHLLFSLPFGAWIDASSRRRRLMVLTDLARGAVVALVPLAYASTACPCRCCNAVVLRWSDADRRVRPVLVVAALRWSAPAAGSPRRRRGSTAAGPRRTSRAAGRRLLVARSARRSPCW
jgi:MFS family permease